MPRTSSRLLRRWEKLGASLPNLGVAGFAELGEGFQGGVEGGFEVDVERFGGGIEVLIEFLRRHLAFGDLFQARQALVFAFGGGFFGAHGARFLELEPAQAGLGHADALDGDFELVAEPLQLAGAKFGVAVLEFGVERVPVGFEQVAIEIEGFAEAS